MSVKLQVVIACIVLLIMFIIVNMVRKKKIDLRYAISWIFFDALILLLDIFPGIIFLISNLIGIQTPSNAVFFVGFIIISIIIYSLAVSLSHLSAKTKKLAQELALLKEELKEYKK